MFRNDEIEYATNDDGRKVAILEMGSQILPMISVDTYGLFTGDGYFDTEWDYFHSELGLPDSTVEIKVSDHDRLLRSLADTSHQWVTEQLFEQDEPAIMTHGDVTGVWSPQFYNFATDQYDAKYAIDLELMEEWIASRNWNHVEYGEREFASYSGFASHVPGYLQDPDMSEGVRLWLFAYAYLTEVFGLNEDMPWVYDTEDDWKMSMWEEEWEIYHDASVAEWDKFEISRMVNDRLGEGAERVTWRDVATPEFEPYNCDYGEGESRFNAWLEDYTKQLATV